MEIIFKKISDLRGYENNARLHSENQIQEICNSIKNFGFNDPIELAKDNMILSGHGRLAAAIKLNMEEVPTITHDHLTETQKKAYILAANRIALSSSWDNDILKHEFLDLKDDDFDLSLTGFTDDEINMLLNCEELNEGLGDENAVGEVQEDPISKYGDVWILGEHRLMCGDSTSIDAVDKLMNGVKADMVFTDPPYGINEETDRVYASRSRLAKGNKFSKIIGDDSIDTALAAYSICETLSDIICYWGGNYYAHKIPASACWLIWDKRVEENQRDMNSDCEIAYVKHPKKESVRIFRHLWKGMIKGSEQGEGRVHPTQKPIALAEWCFEELNPKGKTVLDLFGGSGSTLIACEKTGRHCYMMELDPKYCDVIVRRYIAFTGKEAILESTGESFNG
jgi:DNA modification methylase